MPLAGKIKRVLFGNPKNLNEPGIFHKIALIPVFAWIGLGADGLSSSAYGPEEAFRTLGEHSYLAVFIALATILTITVISYSYSKIIEHFPSGGGGYLVATKMLGKSAGVVSGSALIIDYILTITVSIAACSDAIFSYLPFAYHDYKIFFSGFLIIVLIMLNIRGVKESIAVLAPIFMIFVLSHAFMIAYGAISNAGNIGHVATEVNTSIKDSVSSIGVFGILLLLFRAYSLGGGTYTGIEAVSNGLQIMREPKVKTGKRTMLYMALSLSIAAGGLLICYLLLDVNFVQGKTLNSALADKLYSGWAYGDMIAFITIFSEGALLFVAAQAGFIDAPRVMANMAVDSWLPRRFRAFSEHLTMRNGILIIGFFSIAALIYTKGSITALVVMYSINVFVTFSISQFGMLRHYLKHVQRDLKWLRNLIIFFIGFMMTFSILVIIIIEKFTEGGWVTLLLTSSLIFLCYIIKSHYNKIAAEMKPLEENIPELSKFDRKPKSEKNVTGKTAVQLVYKYSGFGIHTFLNINSTFPGVYKNFIFVSVAVIDQSMFKENETLENIKIHAESSLKKYVELAENYGFYAESHMEIATNISEKAIEIIEEISKEYEDITVFSGKLAFHKEKFWHRILHNDTAHSIQKQLEWKGITNVILPIRL